MFLPPHPLPPTGHPQKETGGGGPNYGWVGPLGRGYGGGRGVMYAPLKNLLSQASQDGGPEQDTWYRYPALTRGSPCSTVQCTPRLTTL